MTLKAPWIRTVVAAMTWVLDNLNDYLWVQSTECNTHIFEDIDISERRDQRAANTLFCRGSMNVCVCPREKESIVNTVLC